MKPLNMSAGMGSRCTILYVNALYRVFHVHMQISRTLRKILFVFYVALFIVLRTMVNKGEISGLNKLCAHIPGENFLKLRLVHLSSYLFIYYIAFLIPTLFQ